MTQIETNVKTIAAIMRDMSRNGVEIASTARLGSQSGMTGLYMPNGMTFWIVGYTQSDNDPNWNSVFFHVSETWDDRPSFPDRDNRDSLMYDGYWKHAGNMHGGIKEYTHAYMIASGFDDGYYDRPTF